MIRRRTLSVTFALAAAALASLAAPADAQPMSKYFHLVSPQNVEVHATADGVIAYDYLVDWPGLQARFPGKSLFVALGARPHGVNDSVVGEELVPGQTTSFFKVAPLLQSLADHHGKKLPALISWDIMARPRYEPGKPVVEPERTEVFFLLVLDGSVVLPKPAAAVVAAPTSAAVAVAPALLDVPKVDAAAGATAHLGAHLALGGKPQAGYAGSFVLGGGEVATATTGAAGDAHADWTVPAMLAGKATSIHAEIAKGPQGVAVSGTGLLVVAAPPKALPLPAPATRK